MHVEESWCHYFAGRIDHAFGFYGGASDIDNSVAFDGDVAVKPGVAAAIDDATVHDDHVVRRLIRRSGRCAAGTRGAAVTPERQRGSRDQRRERSNAHLRAPERVEVSA